VSEELWLHQNRSVTPVTNGIVSQQISIPSPTVTLYIMSIALAGNNSQNRFASVLTRLDWLLVNLPTQLPQKDGAESCYQAFLSCGLDPNILEKMGDKVAMVGKQLEGVFGWMTHTLGPHLSPMAKLWP
jgi:hypothetical protein